MREHAREELSEMKARQIHHYALLCIVMECYATIMHCDGVLCTVMHFYALFHVQALLCTESLP